jgi:hypothetical protein
MDGPGEVVNVPVPAPVPEKYSRARQLLSIIETAAMQLRQDAENLEQEDLALAMRLTSIEQAVKTIQQNDPLLRG